MGERYVTGHKNGRTIYQVQPDGSEVMVGSMDTRELARLFVDAVNGRLGVERAAEEVQREVAAHFGAGPARSEEFEAARAIRTEITQAPPPAFVAQFVDPAVAQAVWNALTEGGRAPWLSYTTEIPDPECHQCRYARTGDGMNVWNVQQHREHHLRTGLPAYVGPPNGAPR